MLPQAIVLVLLINCHIAASTSIIRTLPGFSGDLPFKLETGYVGVGDEDYVQLFYYFVESQRSPENDPLLFWLTGGPGCSGFDAFLITNVGPVVIDYAHSSSDNPKILLNPNAWTKFANILFLDAPVGTGFSYPTTWEGHNYMSDTLSTAETYQFYRKWLLDHPKFLKHPLYVGGDSYSGMVLPMIVQEITDGIEEGLEPVFNLKGYILGNPVTETAKNLYYQVRFAHGTGLISDELYESIQTNCKGEDYSNVNPNNTLCVDDLEAYNECIEGINSKQILEPLCEEAMGSKRVPNDVRNKDSVNHLVSFAEYPRGWCREDDYVYAHTWLNNETVQNAFGIREGTIQEWKRCNWTLKSSYTFEVTSSVVYHQNLIKEGYKVLIYSGDHDMSISHFGTSAWIKSLNLTVASQWKPWFVDGQVAGYMVQYTSDEYEKYHLTFATVKGAGHVAPTFKPEEAFSMVYRWFLDQSLPAAL